jgi:hypothetical protein
MLHLISVYGYANDTRKRDALLTMVLEAAARLGEVPILVMGDLNVAVDDSTTLDAWFDISKAVPARKQL